MAVDVGTALTLGYLRVTGELIAPATSLLAAANITGALTVGTVLQPDANDGAVLGSATRQWSDLFLAEGGVIDWDNGDATLTQVGNVVTLAGADLALPTLAATGGITSSSPSAGIGYATGAGGAVTQLTNKATGVTLNTITGRITMEATAALGADTTVAFTLTNSAIAATDLLVLSHVSGGTLGAYILTATPAAGSAVISVHNATPGILTEAPVIAFAVIKAVTA